MKFFGRKRASVTLVRAWCSPFGEDGPAGELLALVDRVLASQPAQPLSGVINHGYTQEMSSLRRALAKMKPVQLDALSVRDESDEVICSFGAEGASVGDRSRAFEIFRAAAPGRRRRAGQAAAPADGPPHALRLRAGAGARPGAGVRDPHQARLLQQHHRGGRWPRRLAGARDGRARRRRARAVSGQRVLGHRAWRAWPARACACRPPRPPSATSCGAPVPPSSPSCCA